MNNKTLTFDEVYSLAYDTLHSYNCNQKHAEAVARTIVLAEQNGSHSHGLFRLPGYVATLKSLKVKGAANPTTKALTPCIVQVNGDNCFAPYALEASREQFIEATKTCGIAALSLTKVHHFSSLWIEIEALTQHNLCAMAFTAYMPSVAPAGSSKPFFGTNPMAFGWPRKDKPPMIFDQATATMARGDVMIAARDGKTLPLGVGVDANGNDTTDPNEILNGGCLLPFGGYKGSNIGLMIELLVGPLLGERASVEAAKLDNKDGGPPQGGELIIAIDPTKFGSAEDPFAHAERLFSELLSHDGVHLPGMRRYKHRNDSANSTLSIPEERYQQLINL
jgi:delta1-piperideine-2-carboxylate reductase